MKPIRPILLLILTAGTIGACQNSVPAPAPRLSTFPTSVPPQSTSPLGPVASPDEPLAPSPLYTLFGRTLIVPASRLFPTGALATEALLDDGRKVPIVLHRIAVESISDDDKPLTRAALRWLGGATTWTEISPTTKVDPRQPVIELCEVKLPVDSFGHWLWIGKERVDLAWISANKKPRKIDLGSPAISKSDSFLLECLRLASLNPLARWRPELLGYSIPPQARSSAPIPFAPDDGPLVQNPDDAAVLDRLAQQTAALWNEALSRLSDADPAAGKQILEAIAPIIQFENDAVARLIPAWPDSNDSDQLLQSLLTERDNPRRLGFVARAWLTKRPVATAWVRDDAGLIDADSKQPLPRIGVANFTPSRVVAWARGEGEALSPELVTVDPFRTRLLTIPGITRPAPTDGSIDRTEVEVHVGTWGAQLPVQRRRLIATPPGLPIAPAFLDHTMFTWIRAQNVSPLPTGERSVLGSLTGRLVREAGPSNTPSGSGWSLYFEVEKSMFEHQTLRISFGASGRASQIILVDLPETSRIPESGEGSAILQNQGSRNEVLQGAQIIPAANRWTIRLPIPNRAIERPGLLRMAVEHSRGDVRSCWPRPMFPWSTEPGRALIDLTAW